MVWTGLCDWIVGESLQAKQRMIATQNGVPGLSGHPLVSVVINNYNYALYLSTAIDSALNQTYAPIEVIVIDDGSTDNSGNVLEGYKGRIRVVRKANGGQASTYNRGYLEASGELILFLDADDMLEPAAIMEAASRWEPGVSKVHFHLQVVEGIEATPTDILLPTCRLAEGDLVGEILAKGHYNSPPASGNLYCRKALSELFPMPEAEWRIAADTYPIFLSAFVGEVRACNKALGKYRVHGKNQDAQTEITAALLRYRLSKETHRDEMFRNFCEKKGFVYELGTVQKHVGHLKIRLASLLLDPKLHPVPGDRCLNLLLRILRATFQTTGNTRLKKLLIVAWAVSAILAPKRLLSQIVELGFVPTKRPSIVKRLFSAPPPEQRVTV